MEDAIMNSETKEELKDRFFKLRAIDGKSLRAIEAELGVTKKTLCSWGQEMALLIKQAEDFRLDEIAKKYRFTETAKMEILGELYEKFYQELIKRDLAEIPSDKLLQSLMALQDKLQGKTEIHTGDVGIPEIGLDTPKVATF